MLFGDEHVRRYEETDGAEGHDWQGTTTLILTTTGRKSRRQRQHPLIYQKHGDGYLVVASKGGADEPPSWYLNLVANPDVRVQVMGDKFAARQDGHAGRKARDVAADGGGLAGLRRLPEEDRPRDPGGGARACLVTAPARRAGYAERATVTRHRGPGSRQVRAAG
jgi:deazaflavin-dependent oxidoreductase (nitroreductase family)